jgi:hypothetical protein
MNPGFENYDQYIKYRNIIRNVKSIQQLDGLDINDIKSLNPYNKADEEETRDNVCQLNENDINNIIKLKKRQSTITYSQRMLKKADNLTRFNRKNHSEGNKHITNDDL